MKLLSPQDTNDSKARETALAILRIKELQEAEKKARIALANSEAEFNLTLAKNREKWSLEEKEHFDRMKDLVKEVKTLEKAREAALRPIESIKKAAEQKLHESEQTAKRLEKESIELEELRDCLENKLDTLADKEAMLSTREQKIENQKKGIEQQAALIAEDNKRLSLETENLIEQKLVFSESVKKYKTEAALFKVNMENREIRIIAQQQDLKEWATRLKDERDMLARNWQELERKRLSP